MSSSNFDNFNKNNDNQHEFFAEMILWRDAYSLKYWEKLHWICSSKCQVEILTKQNSLLIKFWQKYLTSFCRQSLRQKSDNWTLTWWLNWQKFGPLFWFIVLIQ